MDERAGRGAPRGITVGMEGRRLQAAHGLAATNPGRHRGHRVPGGRRHTRGHGRRDIVGLAVPPMVPRTGPRGAQAGSVAAAAAAADGVARRHLLVCGVALGGDAWLAQAPKTLSREGPATDAYRSVVVDRCDCSMRARRPLHATGRKHVASFCAQHLYLDFGITPRWADEDHRPVLAEDPPVGLHDDDRQSVFPPHSWYPHDL